ncbi:hypothetical protein Rhow_000634 [Rhodococcus wratislaviensis]|uniref:Uncharacterized protein n=1 Tax=Rhodococcus wratislaviensis TaxID=44752 RepID=A0A402C2H6_RHOWR|nr:hypothetical protein Rhow_000634 [Rhodococcus wratislaviensis]
MVLVPEQIGTVIGGRALSEIGPCCHRNPHRPPDNAAGP